MMKASSRPRASPRMSSTPAIHPKPVRIRAVDGYVLGAVVRRHAGSSAAPRPLVIINPATSVCGRYYARFADYLHANGCDVLLYDYRGIGGSAHGPVRKLQADWIDWGACDFEGVLRYVLAHFPGQPIDVVGHSIGGFVIGLAESAHRVRRIFTMGAQFAYWRDYAPNRRKNMFLRWHVAMPLLACAFGYVPGRRLGWMEDTPKGVALDWARMGPRFELCLRRGRRWPDDLPEPAALLRRFAQVQAPILALGIDDDPFGTVPAIDRLLGYYRNSERHHLRLAPAALGQEAIGHFAFFQQRFQDALWPIALDWLRDRKLPALARHLEASLPEGHAANPASP
jgi:predicted alpha/beta hydrolase